MNTRPAPDSRTMFPFAHGVGARPVLAPLFFVTLLLAPALARGGTVVSGSVSGTWGLSESPYWVEGDLSIASGSTLTIQPGVQVRFRGPYRLMVNGTLQAAGTGQDSILFTWDQPQSSYEWRGIRLVGCDPATRLELCRIEHVRSSTAYPDVQGGAVYCSSCSPVIRSCLMQHNVSHNANSNGMGGGVAVIAGSPRIESCIIRMNNADSGGGICAMEEGCSPVIQGNLITGNTAPYAGGGIYAGVRSSPVIENNVITGNSASGWGGGGITLWNWYAMNHIGKVVRNNVVAGNSTTAVGGGFYIRYDYSILDNNTVSGNTASGGGGGLYILNAGMSDFPPDVRNFVIWGNGGAGQQGIYLDPTYSAAVNVAYSDVQGGWSGIGNMNVDPMFADPYGHLDTASPCIDTGDPGPGFNDACFPPSQGGVRNDMGAYGGPAACQWPSEPAGIPVATKQVPVALRSLPEPFLDRAVVSYELPEAAPVQLTVHDASGALVRTLVSGNTEPAGPHAVIWDGTDGRGREVPAGTYYYRLRAGSLSATGRAVRIR
jgi:parallel beta-helix repeat protein